MKQIRKNLFCNILLVIMTILVLVDTLHVDSSQISMKITYGEEHIGQEGYTSRVYFSEDEEYDEHKVVETDIIGDVIEVNFQDVDLRETTI